MAGSAKGIPRLVTPVTEYHLQKHYAGTVLEVGTDDMAAQQYVVLDVGEHGRLRLNGLTMPEARALGAALYRPIVVKIHIEKARTT